MGWCAIRGRDPDANSRSEYVAEKLSAKIEGEIVTTSKFST